MWNKGTTRISTSSYYYYHTPTSTPAPARSVKHDTGRTCLRSPQTQQDLSNMTQAGLAWDHPKPSRNCQTWHRLDLPEITPNPARSVKHDTGRTCLRSPQTQQDLSNMTQAGFAWDHPKPSKICQTWHRPDLPEITPNPARSVKHDIGRTCLRSPHPYQDLSNMTQAGLTWDHPKPSRNCKTWHRLDLPESTPTPVGTVSHLRVPQPQQELSPEITPTPAGTLT